MAKKRASGDGLLRKRTDGRWEGRIIVGHNDDGSPIWKSVFGKTQKEVQPKLHKLIETYRGVDLTEDSRMMLSEWLDKWLEKYASMRVRATTLKRYRETADLYIKPTLGNKRLTSLATSDIQKTYNELKKSGRIKEQPHFGHALSGSTVRGIHLVLHQALDTAVSEHIIPFNPTEGVTLPKLDQLPTRVLNDSQVERFLATVAEELWWGDFFKLEMLTGLREGELCGLKWSDYHSDTGVLNVRRTVSKASGVLIENETKTENGIRSILLPSSATEILGRRLPEAVSEWIFPNPFKSEEPVSPSSAYRNLKRILKKAGLPDIRFHDLRHTFATQAVESGVDPKTLSSILGHSKPSFSLDRYAHVTSDMQKNAANVMGTVIESLMGGAE